VPYFWAGSKLYDVFAGSQRLESSYFLSKGMMFDQHPQLMQSRHLGWEETTDSTVTLVGVYRSC
jgi:glycerol-3-phosphate dehydrogenase